MMQTDKLINNYEFKVIKRMIMREFPFVIDVTPSQDQMDYKTVLFLDITIDNNKLNDYYNIEPTAFTQKLLDVYKGAGADYRTSYFNTLYSGDDAKRLGEFRDQVEAIMNRTHKSQALPIDLKQKREPSIGSFILKLT